MNKRILAGALLALATAAANAQTFTAGEIYVNTINYAGLNAPTAAGNTATLLRLNPTTGTFDRQISTGIFNSGTATSEGALQYDPTTNTLWLGGYQNSDAAGVAASLSSVNPRVFGRVSGDGTVTQFTTSTDYNGNNIRSVVGIGNNIYTAGTANSASTSTAGTRSYTIPAAGTDVGTGTLLSGTNLNTRVASFYDGNAYYTTSTGLFQAGSTTSIIPAVTGSSFYGFKFSPDGLKTLYIADDSTGNTGISKYNLVGGAYTLAGRYNVGATRSFALLPDATGNTTIYFTNGAGTQILSFADDNAFGTRTATTVATAGTNERYRGIEVVPEPASMAVIGVGLIGLAARRRRKSA